MTAHDGIAFRAMVAEDIDRYPTGCQGARQDVAARIRDLGASAILAFDGARHVGQLQFRRQRAHWLAPSRVSGSGALFTAREMSR